MDDSSHPIHSYFLRLSKLIEPVKSNGNVDSSMTVEDLPTPSHLADFSRMLRNCDEMLARATERKVTVRPHVKTHKTIEGALLCLFGSSLPTTSLATFKAKAKVVVSTLGEAKFFADHGFCDILYAAPIVPSKLKRIEAIINGDDESVDIHAAGVRARLEKGQVPGLSFPSANPSGCTSNQRKSPKDLGVSIAVLIDSKYGFEVVKAKVNENASKLSSGQAPVLHPLRLWVDVDGGYHRTGMNFEGDSQVGELLKEMAKEMVGPDAPIRSASSVHGASVSAAVPNYPSSNSESGEGKAVEAQIILDGIYYHGGNSYGSANAKEIEEYSIKERDAVKGMIAACEAAGLHFGSKAVGSTPTCSKPPAELHPINEFHPGNYIFYDSWQALIGSCEWERNASWVLAQIISSYSSPDRVAFDAGALALSKDLGATHVRDIKASAGQEAIPESEKDSSASSAPMSSHPSPLGPSAALAEFGILTQHAETLYLARITQEMGIIQVRPSALKQNPDTPKAHLLLAPSQRIRIIPNHSCLSAACFPSLFIVNGDNVVDEWITAPRIW